MRALGSFRVARWPGAGGCRNLSSQRLFAKWVLFAAWISWYPGLQCRASSSGEGDPSDLDLEHHKVVGCDQQIIFMSCPSSTIIDVVQARYGRQVPGYMLCPYAHQRGYNQELESEQLGCSADSALFAVMQLCQERRVCKLNVNAKAFGGDPCPRVGKYLDVTYRCMPSRYSMQFACEGSTLQLACNHSQKLYIENVYSWKPSAGNSGCSLPLTYEALRVTDQAALLDTGSCADAEESSIKRQCAGKRYCSLDIVRSVCHNSSKSIPGQLRRVDIRYTCISRATAKGSLMTPATNQQQADGPQAKGLYDTAASVNKKAPSSSMAGGASSETAQQLQNDTPGWRDTQAGSTAGHGCAEPTKATSNGVHLLTTLAGNRRQLQRDEPHINNVLMGWVHSIKYVKDNEEKLTLYGLVCGCVALLLVLGSVTARLLYLRHKQLRVRRKLSVSAPLTSSDQCSGGGCSSSDGNTYVPALDPSDVAMLSYNMTPGASYGIDHSSLLFRSDDVRKTFYENDDSNDSDRTRVNSLYDRHS